MYSKEKIKIKEMMMKKVIVVLVMLTLVFCTGSVLARIEVRQSAHYDLIDAETGKYKAVYQLFEKGLEIGLVNQIHFCCWQCECRNN